MADPRVLILKAAGTNCDRETAAAFQSAGAYVEPVHINELTDRSRKFSEFQIVAISGGFTYGDDIAAGKILANEIKYKLFDDVKGFILKGGLIIGICNGFQVLVRAGVLPGNPTFDQEATLSGNDSGMFQDQWVHLKKPSAELCVWTRGVPETIYLPIAHGEGKFIPKSEEVLERLKKNGQIVFQYVDNPNGSVESIAGICDETGRVFGLMPHPERHATGLQHPRWTREGVKKHGDGLAIFQNAVNYFK